MAYRVLTHARFRITLPGSEISWGGNFPDVQWAACVGEEERGKEVQGQGESIPLTHVTSDNYCVKSSRTPYGVSKWLFRNIKEICETAHEILFTPLPPKKDDPEDGQL